MSKKRGTRKSRSRVKAAQEAHTEEIFCIPHHGGWRSADIGDFNGDGKTDILFREGDRSVKIFDDLTIHEWPATDPNGVSGRLVEGMPPGLLIDMLVPAARADDMLLALSKAFEQRWLPKYGSRRARLIFLVQSMGSVVGYWISWVRKNLNILRFFAS
jgi:hypothetical protein